MNWVVLVIKEEDRKRADYNSVPGYVMIEDVIENPLLRAASRDLQWRRRSFAVNSIAREKLIWLNRRTNK